MARKDDILGATVLWNKNCSCLLQERAKSTVLAGIRANRLPNSHRTVTICHIKAAASGFFSFNDAHIAAALSPYLHLFNPHILFSFCALVNHASG